MRNFPPQVLDHKELKSFYPLLYFHRCESLLKINKRTRVATETAVETAKVKLAGTVSKRQTNGLRQMLYYVLVNMVI